MRRVSIVTCLMMMMMTVSLSGCIGGNDVQTEEGDAIMLEDTDDWPTYYVPSASDLPTCDSSTLGRLYYVEADANFQACMSTGWQVVQIGGSAANVVLNQAPIVETNYWLLNDDLLTDISGDGQLDHTLVGLHWDARDVDGTISQIGIDYDGDNNIDINLPQNSGVHSEDDYIYNGNVISGLFAVPLTQGLTVHQSVTPSTCLLSITRTIAVIAVDDGGATGISSQTMSAIDPILDNPIGSYHFIDAYEVASSTYLQSFLTQSDIDWVMGNGNSPCPVIPTFSLTAGNSYTAGDSDVIATLTLDSGIATALTDEDCNIDSFTVFIQHSDGSTQGYGCQTWNQQNTGLTITASGTGTSTDTWVITEDGTNICSAGSSNDCAIIWVEFSFDELGDSVYCVDSINGSDSDYCDN